MNNDHLVLARGMFDLFSGPVSLDLKAHTKPIVEGMNYDDITNPPHNRFNMILIGQYLFIKSDPSVFSVGEIGVAECTIHTDFRDALKAVFAKFAIHIADAFVESSS